MTTSKDIHSVLQQKVGYEVVTNTEKVDQLRVVGRIHTDRDGRNMNNWILVMDRLFEAAYDRPWAIDLSKHYFKRGKGQPVVFGWRIIFQAANIAEHYADIVNLIHTAPVTARTEVTEMPMPGSMAHRNNTSGGRRGAGPAGSIAVGPAAVAQKNAGG